MSFACSTWSDCSEAIRSVRWARPVDAHLVFGNVTIITHSDGVADAPTLHFGMSHETETAALNDALAMVKSAPSAVAERQLVDAACALVAVLQESGWPIERVLAHVKQIAAHAGFAKFAMGAGDELRNHEEIVVDRLVHECIEHYYRADPP